MLAENPIVVQVKRWCLRKVAGYITGEKVRTKANAAHGSAKLSKSPKIGREELRKGFEGQGGGDNISPLHSATPVQQVKENSANSQATRASFQDRLKRAKLGEQHEALGSHPWKSPGAWPEGYKIREVAGQGIRDTENEVDDNWSTLVNASANRICNVGSEQDLSMPEYIPLETALRLKREAACKPCERTKAQRDQIQSEASMLQRQCEKQQIEISHWRIQCDKLRGEKSDLKRLVDRARWAVEEWTTEEHTGPEAMRLVEDMPKRLGWSEFRCPQLRAEFDLLVKEEKAELEAKAERKRIRRAERSAERATEDEAT
ncbi:hypothetical protein QQX98_004798 [Neonectria punicea]|uniref:Uncharacterized protein n=1 Tax=Neonectria punicea TaxID=979145 RepID=A0ABR1H7W3_9HYPO